jgi:hypothetical protein
MISFNQRIYKDEKTNLGLSSPAIPAFIIPEP